MTNKEIAIRYADDVLAGNIVACSYVKQAASQFLATLNNQLYYYDDDAVNSVVTFISNFYLSEDFKDVNFVLEPWQTFIIVGVYGFYNKHTNERKVKQVYIELARKSGKSQLITILALYHLLVDDDAQVIISANSREQAKNVDFKKIKNYCSQIDKRGKHLIQYYNKIVYNSNELIVTASDASKLDGLNASFVLIDEFHEAKNNELYNVLKSSQGSRNNALFFIITTGGFDTSSFCYSLRTYATEVLSNAKSDDSLFSLIYTLDEGDDYTNPNVWLKSNPNLGKSLKTSWLQGEVNKAINNSTERAGVLVKNFNVWLKSATIENWLDDKYIKQSQQQISIDDAVFNSLECFVGVDLASVSDIAAVSTLIELDGKLHFFNSYYLCEDATSTNINRMLYKQAAQAGNINITIGNVVDYDYILNDIISLNEKHFINSLYYDKWNATQFAINATAASINLKPYSQLPGSLNKPLKEFERLIKSGKIIIQDNSITEWMFKNVELEIDRKGNYSIKKNNRSKKIDGVAAMINALAAYLESPRSINIF